MPAYDPKVRKRIRREILAAYVLIILITGIGFWRLGQQQSDLCNGAAENREALRSVVNATADLGRGLILGDPQEHPDNPTEGAAINRVEDFRKAQLEDLELPICE
jgi:hypothetical protein